ncbi:Uncharacterized alpha/beta hydrolase domain (DUF2235) domain containing protein [Rhypophila decipiens]
MAPRRHTYDSRAIDAAKKTRKRLFVCCDGTWQDGVNKTRPLTNVATLARCLSPVDENGCLQIIYYDGGVGNSTGTLSQIIDGATGRGISAKIRNAYSFLSHNYNFEKGWDEIVLIGFSRGAFAVQCLAAFISDVGLLEKQHLYYLRGLFTLWSSRKVAGAEEKYQEGKRRLSGLLQTVVVTACAVFDTVSALGTWAQLPPRPLAFVGRSVPLGVRNAFQALALDERRRQFQPAVWESLEPGHRRGPDDIVCQCWFMGTHGDVGGNGDAALGALSFLWMAGKLEDKIGVSFDEDEIAKHLKHKFLEWDFAVSRSRRTFTETRALSMRKHTGKPTPQKWYWSILGGRKSRALYLSRQHALSPEIHFSVRFIMATSPATSTPIKRWTADWAMPPPDQGTKVIQWQSTQIPKALKSDNPGQKPGAARLTLYEHPLGKLDKEYDLIDKWSNGRFPDKPTDRGKFAGKMEKTVQEDESNKALNNMKDLFKDRLMFEENGQLALSLSYTAPASTGG